MHRRPFVVYNAHTRALFCRHLNWQQRLAIAWFVLLLQLFVVYWADWTCQELASQACILSVHAVPSLNASLVCYPYALPCDPCAPLLFIPASWLYLDASFSEVYEDEQANLNKFCLRSYCCRTTDLKAKRYRTGTRPPSRAARVEVLSQFSHVSQCADDE